MSDLIIFIIINVHPLGSMVTSLTTAQQDPASIHDSAVRFSYYYIIIIIKLLYYSMVCTSYHRCGAEAESFRSTQRFRVRTTAGQRGNNPVERGIWEPTDFYRQFWSRKPIKAGITCHSQTGRMTFHLYLRQVEVRPVVGW